MFAFVYSLLPPFRIRPRARAEIGVNRATDLKRAETDTNLDILRLLLRAYSSNVILSFFFYK